MSTPMNYERPSTPMHPTNDELIAELPTFVKWRFTRFEKILLGLALQRIYSAGRLSAIQEEHRDARSRLMDDLKEQAQWTH
jgi:hypothetical protein